MLSLARLFLLCLPLSASAVGVLPDSPKSALVARAAPLYPSKDPFYAPPKGFKKKKPGTILRHRLVSNGLTNINNSKAAYQLLYRTSDNSGNPQAAMTTVIVPNSGNSSRLLSYLVPYDSADVDCSPSYSLQNGASANTTSITGDPAYINDLLGAGYYVNVPDYEGPQAAFTAGLQAGYATLDSVRAALQSKAITGVSPSAVYQMWGYSGGGLAGEWAAELQASYAPELHFASIAIGGLTPNVTTVLFTVNAGAFAGLIPAGILGLSHAYANLSTYVQKNLKPANAAEFNMAAKQCLGNDIVDYFNQNMTRYFIGGVQALYAPIPHSVVNHAGIMGLHGVPQMPVYVYKAVHDEVSPVAETDALVNKFCKKGVTIQYVRARVGSHLAELQNGAPGAMAFLADRFNGVPLKAGCNITTVN